MTSPTAKPLCFVQWHKLVQLGSGEGGWNSATGNLGFATYYPSLQTSASADTSVSVNNFRGIALAPRACTYGYSTSPLGFRELEVAEEEEGAAAAEQETEVA